MKYCLKLIYWKIQRMYIYFNKSQNSVYNNYKQKKILRKNFKF